jgi:hypothetical protein
VRVDAKRDPRALAGAAQEIVDALTGELLIALGEEEPRKTYLATLLEVALERSELVRPDGVLGGQAPFLASNPYARSLEVESDQPEIAKL